MKIFHVFIYMVALVFSTAFCKEKSNATSGYTFDNSTSCMLFYAREIRLVQGDRSTLLPQMKLDRGNTHCTNSSKNATIVFTGKTADPSKANVKITLNFVEKSREHFWCLEQIALNVECAAAKKGGAAKNCTSVTNLKSGREGGGDISWLAAPIGSSFHCGKRVEFEFHLNKTITKLQFTSFQIQLWNLNKNGKFSSHPNDCVGFFSIGVFSTLFVSMLLIAILTYGLSIAMSLQTMTQFDDPKKKPIQLGPLE